MALTEHQLHDQRIFFVFGEDDEAQALSRKTAGGSATLLRLRIF